MANIALCLGLSAVRYRGNEKDLDRDLVDYLFTIRMNARKHLKFALFLLLAMEMEMASCFSLNEFFTGA